MKQRVKIKPLPGLMGGLVLAITLTATTASAEDKTISLSGSFGDFIDLGATAEEVHALGPDRIESEPADGNRLTFGFTAAGEMTWVALGALRKNGWTCEQSNG